MTKEQLENKLYERMSAENETFLTDLKAKPVDEIISHAYEIACRDNLLMLFEDETSLSERQLTVLNEFEHPLSQLYTDWLSRDTDEMDAFRDSIACCADDILRKRVEEKYRDPAQPIYPNTRSEAVVRGEVFGQQGSDADLCRSLREGRDQRLQRWKAACFFERVDSGLWQEPLYVRAGLHHGAAHGR